VELNADHSGVCKIGATPADVYNFTLIRRNIADLFEDALQIRELSNMPFVIDHRGRAQAVDDNEFQAMRGWPSQREIVLNTDVDVNLDNFFHTKSYVLFKKAFTNNFKEMLSDPPAVDPTNSLNSLPHAIDAPFNSYKRQHEPSSSGNWFCYTESLTESDIRLFDLMPGSGSDQIRIKFSTSFMTASEDTYVALSYTWNNGEGTNDDKIIKVRIVSMLRNLIFWKLNMLSECMYTC
jgi:hypothetical protein